MDSEALPNTITQSQENIRMPWGKLIPCLSTLDSIVLHENCVKIGKAQDCDIVVDRNKLLINDASISKLHCILTKEPGTRNVSITDLSKNGTFLNGGKIGKNKKKFLRNNDSISLTKEITNLYKPVFKIGRSSQCDAVIDSTEISSTIKNRLSKEHFIILQDPHSTIVFITDLSTSGTYLNGRLIGRNKQNVLQHDDTISVGPKRTRLYVYKSMISSDFNYLPKQLKHKYEISILLGKGSCGEVSLAYEKHTCKLYAIKKITKARSTSSQMNNMNHPSKIDNEINILQSISHPFVINMKDIVETQEEVFIVLEYMKGGELKNRILSNEVLTETNAKFFFYQMVLAVQYLHVNGITHRDLKPENVLLYSDDAETDLKVSDFGLSKVTEEDDMMKTTCGTLCYVAPEVIDSRIVAYDKQADIWSLGVILFYMLSKRLPFFALERIALGKLIICGTYEMDDLSWTGVSCLAQDLVKKMLVVDPQKRIKIDEILIHPWLAQDVAVQYRVHLLLENQEQSDTTVDSYENENPAKRIRLSNSDESLSS